MRRKWICKCACNSVHIDVLKATTAVQIQNLGEMKQLNQNGWKVHSPCCMSVKNQRRESKCQDSEGQLLAYRSLRTDNIHLAQTCHIYTVTTAFAEPECPLDGIILVMTHKIPSGTSSRNYSEGTKQRTCKMNKVSSFFFFLSSNDSQ